MEGRRSTSPEHAHAFAREALAGLTDKAGDPLIAHAERMAERFEDPTLKQVAYLHDVLEDSDVAVEELTGRFPPVVALAVFALTRQAGETYFEYIGRVAQSGSVPRRVKLADIADHLQRREHIPASLARRYERAQKVLLDAATPPVAPGTEHGIEMNTAGGRP